MSGIAKVQTEDRNVNQLQQNIIQAVNPLLANPANLGLLITGVVLIAGTNTISHGLGRVLQGWSVTDVNGIATIYRSLPLNDKTLTLVSSANVTIGLYVI